MTNKEVISILSKEPDKEFGFVYTNKLGREVLVRPVKIQQRYVVDDVPFIDIDDAYVEVQNVRNLYKIHNSNSQSFVETMTVACE